MSRHATYIGEVLDQSDALILLQAVLDQKLVGIRKKLTEEEKMRIMPGDCFVYLETDSDIKRW